MTSPEHVRHPEQKSTLSKLIVEQIMIHQVIIEISKKKDDWYVVEPNTWIQGFRLNKSNKLPLPSENSNGRRPESRLESNLEPSEARRPV